MNYWVLFPGRDTIREVEASEFLIGRFVGVLVQVGVEYKKVCVSLWLCEEYIVFLKWYILCVKRNLRSFHYLLWIVNAWFVFTIVTALFPYIIFLNIFFIWRHII